MEPFNPFYEFSEGYLAPAGQTWS